jgi:hypothetical protein
MKIIFALMLIIIPFTAQSCIALDSNIETSTKKQEIREEQIKPFDLKRDRGTFVEGEVIVRFSEQADKQTIENIISSINGKIIKTVSQKRKTYLIKLPDELSVQGAMVELRNKQEVVSADPNLIYELPEGK